MDMRNIKALAPHKYRIRFKFRDPLTQEQRVYQQTLTDVTLAEARAHRDAARAEVLRVRPQERAAEPLEHYVESYLTSRTRRARGRRRGELTRSTLERDVHALDDHILPEIGQWKADRVRLEDLERVVDHWCDKTKSSGEPYSSATINTWIKVLKLFMGHVADQLDVDDPSEKLAGLPAPPRRGRALLPEEARRLLEWLKEERPQHWAMSFLALSTGARFGELAALHWDQVDEVGGALHLTHSVYKGRRRRGTKTGAEVRAPLTPQMSEALAWHRERLIETGHPMASSSIVFPARVPGAARASLSGYQSRTGLAKALTAATRALDLEPITPHDLRRTFNSMMLEAGVSDVVVRAITGHATSEMTHHYAHISDAAKTRGVGALLKVLEGGKGKRGVNEGEGDETGT